MRAEEEIKSIIQEVLCDMTDLNFEQVREVMEEFEFRLAEE